MGTIIDYLMKFGKYTLEERPFNDVDSLLLCQLSYLKFDGMVPELGRWRKAVKLIDIFQHRSREKLFADERYEASNRALFYGMAYSKRFQNLKLNHYVNLIDNEQEIQFSAITFYLEDGTPYIAYRGTDESIVGWKEDFNMTYKSPIPSQLMAVRYLNRVGQKFSGSFIVGGHSKGGNLAVFAAMKCKPEVKGKIIRVYTNDGPGFVADVVQTADFESIRDRVVKIVPESSLFGMLLQHQEKYDVVSSLEKGGIRQHDPYSWEVENGEFVRKDEVKQSNRQFNERLNDWVNSLDNNEREVFVETLYQVISVTQAETLIELSDEWKENALKMINAIKEVDNETKKILSGIIRTWFRLGHGKSARARKNRMKKTDDNE